MSTNTAPILTLQGSNLYTEGGQPIVLDELANVIDTELAALANEVGNYSGATLRLQRVGTLMPEDTFHALGDLRFNGTNLLLSDVTVGSVSNSAGRLFVTFNSNATQERLDTVLTSIGYSNSSDAPSVTADIEWSFRDGNTGVQGDGINLEVTGITSISIEPVNDVGSVSVRGTTTQGQILTAIISEPDNFNAADVSYEWLAGGELIEGATGSTLLLEQGMVGKAIRARVSYIDDYGYTESSTSLATASITNINDAPSGAPVIFGTLEQGQELSVFTENLSDADGLGTLNYQWLADNVIINGATSSTLVLGQGQVNKVVSVRVTYTDEQGTNERLLSESTGVITNINDTPTGSPLITGTVTQGQVLNASIGTVSDADGLGAVSYKWLANGFEIDSVTGSRLVLTQDLVGKAISVQVSYTDSFGVAETAVSAQTATVLNTNDRPQGRVTIEGEPIQDELLVASAEGLTDADGLGTFNYQWLANGQPIVGATQETLLLDQSVVGKRVSMRVTYTDELGATEVVTSSQTSVIENINDPLLGDVRLNGLALQGETLTITHTLADADGLGVFAYRWFADGVLISGETTNRLLLNQAHIGKTIEVRISYTDRQGTSESVISTPSAIVGRLFAGTRNDDALLGTQGADRFTGLEGNDSFNGAGGNDTLNGSAGNDTLDGGIGADILSGGAGDDTYLIDIEEDSIVEVQDSGQDTVLSAISYTLGANLENLTLTSEVALNGTGNELANLIIGNSAANSLSGANGNDTLDGGAGADTLNGGAGDDTYVIDNSGDVVSEASEAGIDTVLSALNYTLGANLEHLTLTGIAATATGNALANRLTGNAAANTLDGGAGADTLNGGAGDDTYVIDNSGDVVSEASEAGIDTVLSALNYTLGANLEHLTLTGIAATATGNALANRLTGNAAANTLDGGAGADTLNGGAGDDTYVVDNSGDVVSEAGEAGIDTVLSALNYTLGANLEHLTLTGTAATATGNALANRLTGNAAANTLDGGAGADTLNGGAGDDTYVIDNSGDVVSEASEAGIDTVLSALNYTLGANLEHLTLTGTAATATGNALANRLTGNAAANTLDGGAGADTLNGGAGDDTYVVDNSGDVVSEAGEAGIDTVLSALNYTLGANLEHLTLTGTAATATGNALANRLTGNAAANTLDGGAGADTLNGGAGDDTYVVDNSGDVVSEAGEAGIDTVLSALNYTLGANLEHLTLTGTAATATGNALANRLTGNAAANTLDGGAGADTLNGGAGDDTYVVDNSGDVVSEAGEAGIDTVLSALNYTLGANLEHLTLTGTAATATGNALANRLTGNAAANTLDGGAGADTLNGGAGNDTYVVDNSGDVVTEAAKAGLDTVQASIRYSLGANLENLVLTGKAALSGTGNALANRLTGNAAANTLDGGAGADTLNGGAGNDTYVVDNSGDVVSEAGEAGIDTVLSALNYTLGANLEHLTLTGTAATATGNALANRLTGNAAANTLDGGAGADTLNGGAGDDTYVVDNSGDVVSEAGEAGIDTVLSALNYTLGANLEHLTLTGTAATATGNALANRLTGNAAANTLDGGAGADTLNGGAGDDTYVVDNSGDVVSEAGEAGIDTVLSALNYTLGANLEHLTLTGTAATATGNALANRLTGNAAANTLDGGAGADTLNGGAGNDTYVVDNSGDVVTEAREAGIDTVLSALNYTLGANLEHLTLTGTAATATGNALANRLTGNAAANTLDGGAGADTLNGGAGDDTYVIDNSGDVVTEAAKAGLDTVQASIRYSLGANLENLVLTGKAALSGTGNALANRLTGNAAANTLDGGAGADTLNGGAGNDTYVVDNSGDVVTEAAKAGLDTVQASIRYSLGANLENLVLTGKAALSGTGNALANRLTGNAAANTLDGGAGADTLNGGAGNDVLVGGAGKDLLTGGAGNDRFKFESTADSGITLAARDVISDFVRGSDKLDLAALDANTSKVGDQAFTVFIRANVAFSKAGQLQLKEGVLYGNTDNDSAAEFSIALTGITTITLADIIL